MARLCFDIVEMKPGCVLLAAAMGADTWASSKFDPKHWLVAPTDNLRVYEITDDQLAQLVERMEGNTDG